MINAGIPCGIAIAKQMIITMLVPINNRIAAMDPEHPYDCWLQDRRRWDQLHQARVMLLIMAFLLLLTGLFGIPANPIT